MTADELFRDSSEWASFHDAVWEATGKSMDVEELREVFDALPEHIQSIAHSWGLSDTVFRDEAATHLRRSAT